MDVVASSKLQDFPHIWAGDSGLSTVFSVVTVRTKGSSLRCYTVSSLLATVSSYLYMWAVCLLEARIRHSSEGTLPSKTLLGVCFLLGNTFQCGQKYEDVRVSNNFLEMHFKEELISRMPGKSLSPLITSISQLTSSATLRFPPLVCTISVRAILEH